MAPAPRLGLLFLWLSTCSTTSVGRSHTTRLRLRAHGLGRHNRHPDRDSLGGNLQAVNMWHHPASCLSLLPAHLQPACARAYSSSSALSYPFASSQQAHLHVSSDAVRQSWTPARHCVLQSACGPHTRSTCTLQGSRLSYSCGLPQKALCGPADCFVLAFPAWPAELPAQQLPRQLHGGHSGALLDAQTHYEQLTAQGTLEVFLEQRAAQLGAHVPPAGQQQSAPLERELTVFEEMFLRSISNQTSTAPPAQAGSRRLAEPWQNRVAFLIKTGSLAAQQRGGIQLLTWLSGVKNFVLVGNKPKGGHRLGRLRDIETVCPASAAMAVDRPDSSD